MRQSELAERSGLSAKHINQITTETIGITGDVAVALERALDIPAGFWTRAEADYQAYVGEVRARQKFTTYIGWMRKFDSVTLERHQIVSAADDAVTRVDKLLRFFGVANPAAFDQTWMRPKTSFRRSQAFTVHEENTALWLRLVDLTASKVETADYTPSALRRAIKALPRLTTLSVTHGFAAARQELAEAGIALTFVREIPNTRVCSATWWLDSGRPAIGLTARYRRPDSFWFNIAHELAHITLHPKRSTFLNLDAEKKLREPAEAEADEWAENTLVLAAAREQLAHATSKTDLVRIAAAAGVGVAIIAGQWARLRNTQTAWAAANDLRGQITDQEIEELESLTDT